MKLSESYKHGTSIEYTFTAERNDNGETLYESNSGAGGSDIYPAEGDTVTVFADQIDVNLNNKCYYLVSNSTGLNREEIIGQGTEISLSVIGDRLQGSFVFSNPNNFAVLYLMFDYTNIVELGDTITYGSSSIENKVINIPLTDAVGNVNVAYSINNPGGRVVLFYNGDIVDDSGVSVSSTSGNLRFFKFSGELNEAKLVFSNTNALSMTFTSTPTFPGLTRFFICDEDGTISNVGSQIAINNNVWHNGSASIPQAGDIVFTNSTGTQLYDGANSYHVVSPTLMTVPSPTAIYVQLDAEGNVINRGTVACTETLGPVITQGDVTIVQNQRLNLTIEAENNPTTWSIVTPFNEYLLSGNEKGAIFTYTDVNSNAQRVTVSALETQTVYGAALPVLVTGTGSIELVGLYQQAGLPNGITFSNGILSGQPATTGIYDITLIAANCVGDSLEYTFSIIVESEINMTPFAIDVNDFMETGALACSLTPRYDLLYHNSPTALIPDVNDTIFVDMKGTTTFNGGKLWYNIDASTYSVQVDEYGTVIATHTC
jgi:hypothetical protein